MAIMGYYGQHGGGNLKRAPSDTRIKNGWLEARRRVADHYWGLDDKQCKGVY